MFGSSTLLSSSAKYAADAVLLFPYLPKSQNIFLVAASVVVFLVYFAIFLSSLHFFLQIAPGLRRTLFHLAFYLTGMLATVLYLPAFGNHRFGLLAEGIASLSIRCVKDSDEAWVSYVNNSAGCFSSGHLSFAIPGVFAIVGVFAVALGFKFFAFSYPLLTSDPTATTTPAYDVAFTLLRTLAAAVLFAVPEVRIRKCYCFV